MKISLYKINLHGHSINFYAPDYDCTWNGAISGLQKGEFPIEEIQKEKGNIILDIGCNIGIISLILAKCYPECTIHSYDVCPWAIQCLDESIKINEINNIQTHLRAIVASDEEEVFFSYENNGPSCFVASNLTNSEDHPNTGFSCKTIHIKELLQEDIKFFKMDIEGGEYKIFNYLESQPNLIKKINLPHIELHKTNDYFVGAEDKIKNMFENNKWIKF